MSKLGTYVSGSQVEASVTALLQKWLHTYLGDLERNPAFPYRPYPATGHIQRPRSYHKTAGSALLIPDHLLPRITIVSPGWTALQHDGQFLIATWAVNILGYWKGHDAAETQDLVRDVAAMVVLIMEQHTPDIADSSEVLDMNYAAIPAERERTLAGFEVITAITASGVADRFAGPADTDPQPTDEPNPPVDYGEFGTVASTDVTVQNTPIDEEIEP